MVMTHFIEFLQEKLKEQDYNNWVNLSYKIVDEKYNIQYDDKLSWRSNTPDYGLMLSKYNENDIVIFHKGHPFAFIVNNDLKHTYYKNYNVYSTDSKLIYRCILNNDLCFTNFIEKKPEFNLYSKNH